MSDKLHNINRKTQRFRATLNGRSRRGQSLVELTLTLPILLLLLFGMIEIGWYANSYLILLDASREAGRYGATDDPISQWQLDLSNNPYQHDCCPYSGSTFADCPDYLKNQRPEIQDYYTAVDNYLADPNADPDVKAELVLFREAPLRYFDGVACRVISNLSPLKFDWEHDEVVVSVFSYVPPYGPTDYPEYQPRSGEPAITWEFTRIPPSFPIAGGRLPLERNQCWPDSDPLKTIDHLGFTLSGVGDSDCTPADYSSDPKKFCGQCDPVTGRFCANTVKPSGDRWREDDGCWGSNWDPGEIEARLANIDGHGLSGGIVLVEVFWTHEQMLGLPFFSSISNPTQIYVWVMFPVSAAEPTPTPKP